MYQQQIENGGESEHWIYPMGNLDDMIQTMGFLDVPNAKPGHLVQRIGECGTHVQFTIKRCLKMFKAHDS